MAVIGSTKSLGQWDPSKAVQLVTHEGQFPRWNGSVALPEGETVEFKFVKLKGSNVGTWEDIESNRTVVPRGQEAKAVCGVFGRKSDTQLTVLSNHPQPPASEPAKPVAPPSNAVGSGPQHTGPSASGGGGGPMHTGPGNKPVSRFFKTGPSVGSGASRSPHGVGSGPISSSLANAQQAGALAPSVGYSNDASGHQAHGRNAEIYQAVSHLFFDVYAFMCFFFLTKFIFSFFFVAILASSDFFGRQVCVLCILCKGQGANGQSDRYSQRT